MSGPLVVEYRIEGVYVRVRRSRAPGHRYLAVAKTEPFVLEGVDALAEPGPLWFAFGDDQALLAAELVVESKAGRS